MTADPHGSNSLPGGEVSKPEDVLTSGSDHEPSEDQTLEADPLGRPVVPARWYRYLPPLERWLEERARDTWFDLDPVIEYLRLVNEKVGLGLPENFRVIALNPCPYIRHWCLYVSLDDWTGVGSEMQGAVLFVPPWNCEAELTTWAAIRADHDRSLMPESWFVTSDGLRLEDLPFVYRAPFWSDQVQEFGPEPTDQVIWLDGEKESPLYPFVEFGYEDCPSPGRGEYLVEIEWPGGGAASDTFALLTVDQAGGVSYLDHNQSGYLGRVFPQQTCAALLQRHWTANIPEGSCTVCSAVLGSDKILPVLEWLLDKNPELDPEDISISVCDFVGDASELFEEL